MTIPRIILTDADGMAEFSGSAIVILAISRREIETMHTASALERLHVLTDTRIAVLHYRECLAISVDGYDADPRELPEIPEVRRYFQRLVQDWPHWMWFLFRGTGSIALLLSLLCQVRMHRNDDGSYASEILDPAEAHRVFNDLLHRGQALLAAYDIPESDATRSATTALEDVFG